MASKIYPDPAEAAPDADSAETVIRMADVGARVARRKAELGLPELPRNPGTRRTPAKRALLKAIKDAGGSW
ncbi:MAG: hypothetical protein KGL44_11730 [Sphingomonadales bacterium]|nr:hypothetical protein [Sphingomonadales bacterium]